MLVLVVNAGSSSLKCQIIDTEQRKSLVKAAGDRVGKDDATLKFTCDKDEIKLDVANLKIDEVLAKVFEQIDDPSHELGFGTADIEAAGHRIVSGGAYFAATVQVDDDVIEKLDICSKLAPLHNPSAIVCIKESMEKLDVPNAVVMDTAFHMSMPPKAYMYPIPLKYYTDYQIRRYGAHGTSHRYAAEQGAKLIGLPIEQTGIITCHLGNGASISAVKGGKCVDTSMGLTPLQGVMMGTRCGSIDPSIVTNIMRRDGLSPDEMDTLMNHQSGLLGISGISGDMREVSDAAAEGNENAQLALDMYAYSVQKHIGAYYAILPHTNVVVMTAGIGENSVEMREMIFDGLEHLGMILDKEKNREAGGRDGAFISADDSPVKIVVVKADEEMRIAMETAAVARGEQMTVDGPAE